MRNPKSLFIVFAALIAAPILTAQTPPQAFSYQALVRDGTGQPIRNQPVSVRIRLHYDSANTAYSYAETFNPTTNAFGNVNLSLGRGTVVSGTFATLDWSRPMFAEIGVDPNGGTAYVDLGTTQLLSVPYAMYAGRSATAASANLSEIRDGDGNTRVSTERSPNENIIRFDLNGTEKMRLQGGRLEFANNGLSVFIGDSAGFNDDLSGNRNVFVGDGSGRRNVGGDSNTFIGYNAGYFNTAGSGNTYLGYFVGLNGSMGNHNTYIGSGAGIYDDPDVSEAPSGNVCIGYKAGASTFASADPTNKLAIVNSDVSTPLIAGDFLRNSVIINGDLMVTGIFSNPSDRRLKTEIRQLSNALEGVGQINGVYYRWNEAKDPNHIRGQGRQIGVIAQDVEKVYPELVATQPGGYKAVDYPKLTAVLIEAVKEQQKTIADLKDRVMRLEARAGLAKR